MALQASILQPTSQRSAQTSITTGAASAAVALPGRFFVMTTDADVFIRFGGSGVGTPDATDFPLWAKSYLTFDSGTFSSSDTTYVRIFNNGAGTAHVSIFPLSV